jgi:hypothetical protein
MFPFHISPLHARRPALPPQARSYLQAGASAAKYGVEDIVDAKSFGAVINIHAYGDSGAAQLEMPRLTPYLANGVFVVSERGVEAQLEEALAGMLVFVPPGQAKVVAWTWEDGACGTRGVGGRRVVLWGVGCGVWGVGCGVWGAGCGVN